MFRDTMTLKQSPSPFDSQHELPHAITRHAFQAMLHTALACNHPSECVGLLGAVAGSGVSAIALVRYPSDIAQALQQWQSKGVMSVGVFHIVDEPIPAFVFNTLPDPFIQLSLALGEKGRLDVLAFVGGHADMQLQTVEMQLIEDRHITSFV